MVKEGKISFCVRPDSSLKNCLSAEANTTYINTKYDCTDCLINYLPYESKFYERKICHNIFEEIKYTQEINYAEYNGKISAREGKCENNKFFTPDGKYCYKCDNSDIGMTGCKSKCNFSLKRNNALKCLDGCKDGYIESSEGICEYCDKYNNGCKKCHYEKEYPINYLGIKRQRRFLCDECAQNYIKKDGKCISCVTIMNNECLNCKMENNEYKCIQCYDGYYLNDEGLCVDCRDGYFVEERKCIKCNDIARRGIEGCLDCNKNGNSVSCLTCDEEYILLSNNKTCLKISQNEQLKKYINCKELSLNNNHFNCISCKYNYYSILKENDETICIYLPELNGYVDDYKSYNYYNIYYYDKNPSIDYIYKYFFYRYIKNYFSPCLEVINLGTEDNPLYSCSKCFYSDYRLLTDVNSNISYCINTNLIGKDLVNCIDNEFKIKNKKIEYNCTQCKENSNLVYDEFEKRFFCTPIINTNIINITNEINIIDTCMVKYCKICKSDDNYFCEICQLEDYIVNSITGACMKKIETVPDITWKDIFRLEMNSQKEINGRTITGPKLHLRGITNSKINSGHAFLIYLTFKIRQPLIFRNLDETKVIQAICILSNDVEENNSDSNSVDYECIGNANGTDLNNFELSKIHTEKETNNNINSNLEELLATIDIKDIKFGPTYEFISNIQNQTSSNYIFDFKIEGKIDSNLDEKVIETKLQMNEINESSNCSFIIETNKKAYLKCLLNVENYKDKNIFTFKTTKIQDENNYNISLIDLDKMYLFSTQKGNSNKNNIVIWIIIGVVVSFLIIVVTAVIIIIALKKRKKTKIVENKNKNISNIAGNINSDENL